MVDGCELWVVCWKSEVFLIIVHLKTNNPFVEKKENGTKKTKTPIKTKNIL